MHHLNPNPNPQSQSQLMDSALVLVPLPNEEGERINSSNLILLNVTNKKIVTPNALKDVDEEEGGYFCIVGSSHGWLAILDHKGDPFLLNPLSEARVRLPPKETLPNIDHIEQIDEYGGGFRIHYKNSNLPCYCYEPTSYEDILIKKVALSSNPSYGDKFTVVIMYNERLKDKMAFCRNGDDVWSGLECCTDDKDGYLQDIVLFSDQSSSTMLLFALYRQGHSVEVWNMNEPIPSRRSIIENSSYPKITNQIFQSYLYTSRLYLALSSSGEVYSVVRYVGECVDLFTGKVEEHQPGFEVTPYKTIHFHVYKLDPNQKIWAEVKSLKDTALFLGGNHSMMLSIDDKYPGLMGNSIYFTDDNWDRITPDCITFGGHDLGIFNLGDATIKPLLVLEPDPNTSFKINPPPFWLIN